MRVAILTLAALADPAARARPDEMHAIVAEAHRAARTHGVPVGLIVAVALAESGGRNIVSRRRACGGRDVGPMQIHTHGHVAPMLDVRVNVARGAALLAASRARCSARPRWSACARSTWGLYNAGSLTWATRVRRIWRRLATRAQAGVTS